MHVLKQLFLTHKLAEQANGLVRHQFFFTDIYAKVDFREESRLIWSRESKAISISR